MLFLIIKDKFRQIFWIKARSAAQEGRAVRRAVESLTDEVRRLLERQDQRLDALEARLAAQEAEGRGMRRAFGWSASALGMVGAAAGWLLSRGGDWIAALFGPGGTGGGR